MYYFQRIRSLREKHALAPEELAGFLGISVFVYLRYEHGQVRIPFEHLAALAKYYAVELNQLCGIEDQKGCLQEVI